MNILFNLIFVFHSLSGIYASSVCHFAFVANPLLRWGQLPGRNKVTVVGSFPTDPPQEPKTYYSPFGEKGERAVQQNTAKEVYNPFDSFIDDEADEDETEEEKFVPPDLSVAEAKLALLELLPTMTGSPKEYEMINHYIQILEKGYIDQKIMVQTNDFFQMVLRGDWQLLFTTGAMMPHPRIRVRSLLQTVAPGILAGNVTNTVAWDYADNNEGGFDCFGVLQISNSYQIDDTNQLHVELKGHTVRPTGKKIPEDFQMFFKLLQRNIPLEIFDPDKTSMETTYLTEIYV
eukprot:CAMPEP_0113316074 /NCGR_PEP_ID=MMETSP0010_2-20120614/11481_1 /TAXON_ID=216773 ORGANISM="Corethron hystrix, Strain 308" /NCGR_SAMPLE_ID=MMETSP0010_2 /ASSEMBLY_ACC=CAM_ASM_000155 /LENGTH=288 /DNA_ID=CAMNT_0000172689 /DNA_START=20 /DNA_END=887 /DNA_ORIENTATION=+ /assembly_acc=CAM_ASM_000155